MFSRTAIFRVALVLALGFLSVAPSRAGTVTTYSDYASWSAAMADITNVTIPDPGAGTSGLGYTLIGLGNASVTYSGVIFSESGGPLQVEFFNIGVAWSGYPAVVSSEVLTSGLANILITLPGDVTGLALYYGTWDRAGRDLRALERRQRSSGQHSGRFFGARLPGDHRYDSLRLGIGHYSRLDWTESE